MVGFRRIIKSPFNGNLLQGAKHLSDLEYNIDMRNKQFKCPALLRCGLFIFFGLWTVFELDAQELPPVSVFAPKDYLADNQNWSISQDRQGYIFVANNKGLLEFDSKDWRLYPTPNESIIRSVYCVGDTVYSGCFRDFGLWVRDAQGRHHYQSLMKDQSIEMGDDEEIWKITQFEGHIIFQSLFSIYVYNPRTKSINRYSDKNGITRVFQVRNDLFVAIPEKGIYQLDKKGLIAVSQDEAFTSHLIVGMYDIDNEIFVQTNTGGVVSLYNPEKTWAASFFDRFEEMKVYSSYQKDDGSIFIGTVSKGLFCLDNSGLLKYQMNRSNSLSNNTILNIFEDKDANIWLALDNGVNVAHLSSPIRNFYDESGEIGTVYSSTIFQKRLYLGTNQGLFYRDIEEKTTHSFTQIPGSIGQVWSLFNYRGNLFCGHDNGMYLVENNKLKLIDDYAGTWCFRPFPNDSSRILSGHYKGLSVLTDSDEGWRITNRLTNFDYSSRHIEFVSDSLVVVNHEYKGVFKLSLGMSGNADTILKVEQDTSVGRGLYSSLSSIGERVYYAYEEGAYFFDPRLNQFVRDSLLSQVLLRGGYSSGKIITSVPEGVWIFSNSGIHWVRPGKIKDEKDIASIPITNQKRNAMLGYENILQLDYKEFLFGQSGGYFVFDFDQYETLDETMPIQLRSATATNLDGEEVRMSLRSTDIQLKSSYNSVSFSVTIPDYNNYFFTEYQYKLGGYNDQWGNWQRSNKFEVSNLSHGDYTLMVRGRIGGKKYSSDLTYKFMIQRPFWLSRGMIILYFAVAILLLISIHYRYKRYFEEERKREKRKNERKHKLTESENKRKFIRLQNEKLQQEIEAKNRELAISTMGIIKKNRFLNKIKKELRKVDEGATKAGNVVKIIDKNLKSNDDWEFFEKAFNDADKDFFKKVKNEHPELTNNDLRFCAYLRLNLSSKEIAPLLSISPKSVEVKRYRLRKKMNLDAETNLTDYILSI